MMSQSGNFCGTCGASNVLTAKFCRSCGTPLLPIPVAQSNNQTGSLTGTLNNGHYLVLSRLGAGGMGAVYKARDTSLDILVAIKEMSVSSLDTAALSQAEEAFKREARILARLRNHHLPRVYAHFHDAGRWYLVMDYIEGETLEDRLERMVLQRIQVKDALGWALQLCDVLSYLHSNTPPIIFRDLKPANIMLAPDNTLTLVDFGIARFFQPQGTDTLALGSPGYAPPEQYKKRTSPRSDIYALGAVLHQMLTGNDPSEMPFHFEPLSGKNVPELLHHPHILADLATLVASMVNSLAEKRPVAIEHVTQELQRLARLYTQPSGNTKSSPTSIASLPSASSSLFPSQMLLPGTPPGSTSPQPNGDNVNVLCIGASRSGNVEWKQRKDLPIALSLPFTMLSRGWGVTFTFLDITAGNDIQRKTEENIQQAQLVLLLINPEFVASDACDELVKRLVVRARAGENVRVYPVMLQTVDVEGTPFQAFGLHSIKDDAQAAKLSGVLRYGTMLILAGGNDRGPMSLFGWLLIILEFREMDRRTDAFQTHSGTRIRYKGATYLGKEFEVVGAETVIIEKIADASVQHLAALLGAANGNPHTVYGEAV